MYAQARSIESIDPTQHFSRCALIIESDVVINASKSAGAARKGSIRRGISSAPGRERPIDGDLAG